MGCRSEGVLGLCPYGEALGCVACHQVVYRGCSKFVREHIRRCGAMLRPFTLKAGVHVPCADVVYGHYPVQGGGGLDVLRGLRGYVCLSDYLRSMALRAALERYGGSVVRYITFERAISSCFAFQRGDYEFVPGVYFMELYGVGTLPAGDGRLQMVDSFINQVLSSGGIVYLLSSCFLPTVGSDWYQLRLQQRSELLSKHDDIE